MSKPEFNPELPYTFEDTEKDRRELRKALVEWCEITDKFEDSLKYPDADFIRWYGRVTYTPPEPIKVIMSGEKFVLDSGKPIQYKDGVFYTYVDVGTTSFFGTPMLFLKARPNWHTAKLVEEKKPENRFFTTQSNYIDYAHKQLKEGKTWQFIIHFNNGMKITSDKLSELYDEDGQEAYIDSAFLAGATVELVEG